LKLKLSRGELIGETWGGLAAMLVALPSSIAFGVLIFAPLGPSWAGAGAMAGIVGAAALGIIAPIFGGTRALVSSPSAPAAAILAGLAATLMQGGAMQPAQVLVLLTLVGLAAGGLQVAYGAVGAGRLIKYIPYPVISGYLSAVGLQVILGQLPKLFAWPKGTPLWAGLATPTGWQAPALVVGLVTMAAMTFAPRLTKKVPAPILSLAAGVAAYFALSRLRPELSRLDGNGLLIGRIPTGGASPLAAIAERWSAIGQLSRAELKPLATPAIVLSLLLAIDTLKTCVQVDTLTETRHDSNRELFGQGLGNMASCVAGGVPGSGGTGVTLVNMASGGKTRLSGTLAGVFALLAALLFSQWIAWLPLAALAGILLIVGWRMLDRYSLRLATHRSTILDFLVVVVVVATALVSGLMLAAGVGMLMCILLFIRDQMRGSVIRSKTYGNRIFSKQRRLQSEMEILEKRGEETVVCQLQGSLFFGTTDQLFSELEEDLKRRKFVILDMVRVVAVDFTAARMLEQIEARLYKRGADLLFAGVPGNLPTGTDLRAYFADLGIVKAGRLQLFDEVSDALEFAEDEILKEAGAYQATSAPPVDLAEIDLLKDLDDPTALSALRDCVVERSFEAGHKLFAAGTEGDELYLIRRGGVRIVLPLPGATPVKDAVKRLESSHHVATFRRRDFFGEVAFLDRGIRTADAIAVTPTDVYALSRKKFDEAAMTHPQLARQMFYRLSRALAYRLRRTDRELQVLQQA
jgi:sulfate permease, SulP family